MYLNLHPIIFQFEENRISFFTVSGYFYIRWFLSVYVGQELLKQIQIPLGRPFRNNITIINGGLITIFL